MRDRRGRFRVGGRVRVAGRIKLLGVAAVILACSACAAQVDRFTVRRVVARGLRVPDVPKACALGSSLAHPLAALASEHRPPHQALVIAELTGATCGESAAWEAELAEARARRIFGALGDDRAAAMLDAKLTAQRAHAAAADRFWRAFGHLEAEYGTVGEACPRLSDRDELVYVVGLVAGMLAVLNDKAGNSAVGVPLDVLAKVARGAACVPDDRWWHVPGALQAASWATIPGSAPAGADPWQLLADHASAGEQSGVRVARALQVLIAANVDRRDL